MYLEAIILASILSPSFLAASYAEQQFFDEAGFEISSTTPTPSAYLNAMETIRADSGSCGVAINEVAKKVYVTSYTANSLSVINSSTKSVVGAITVGRIPCAIAIDTQRNMVYVINELGNSISVIDGATNHLVDTIEVTRPYEMIINPNTNLLYVTSDATDSVYIIDAQTKDLLNTLSISKPCGIAINRGTNSVSIIDTSTNNVLDSITIQNPYEIAVGLETNSLYVTNRSNSLFVIAGDTTINPISVTQVTIVAGITCAVAAGGVIAIIIHRKKSKE